MTEFVTPIPWETRATGSRYGTAHSYVKAGIWLRGLHVADWGGGRGHLRNYLPADNPYQIIDGTRQTPDTILADLAVYRFPSEGILLRHVLEMTPDWRKILENAVASFTRRMMLITFTPDIFDEEEPRLATHHLTWPVYHFNHEKHLIPIIGPYLTKTEFIHHARFPERVYYLEKHDIPTEVTR